MANVPDVDSHLPHVDHVVNPMDALLGCIPGIAFSIAFHCEYAALEAVVAKVGGREKHGQVWNRLSISALVVFLRGTLLGKDFMYN